MLTRQSADKHMARAMFGNLATRFTQLAEGATPDCETEIEQLLAEAGRAVFKAIQSRQLQLSDYPDWMNDSPSGVRVEVDRTGEPQDPSFDFWDTYWWCTVAWLSQNRQDSGIVVAPPALSKLDSPPPLYFFPDYVSLHCAQLGSTEHGLLGAWLAIARASAEACRYITSLLAAPPETEHAQASEDPSPSPATEAERRSRATHSSDFTTVNWYGKEHIFSKGLQAQTVRVLWQEWERDRHGLAQETIGEKVGSSAERFELAKVFRRKEPGGYTHHSAWGTMIQQSTKGCYRLVAPESA